MPTLTGSAVDVSTAPFRPRLARMVTLALVVVVLVLTAALIAALPDAGPLDQVGFAVVGVAIAWFCWRQASVRAVPDEDGLTVRNLMVTTRLTWPEIVSVRFGPGRPWVQLDLADGDTLAVMGIQSADGARAEAEARRLATLVAVHTTTVQDD
ncbi:PH domain-containing protein [Cellulomonas sp. URHB0016]